jgi:radical SAM superfamily enzyme YgiQ (UPF0313 family)
MKIVLTTLPSEGEFVNWTTSKEIFPTTVKYMPLGLLSLATNISPKEEIVILDPASNNLTINETIDAIEKENADIVGISAVTRKVWALNIILSKISTPYKIVGGPHATHYAESILKAGADAVFVGQLADHELASAIYSKPKGIIYCNTKINDIKFPNRNLLNIQDYIYDKKILFKADKRMPMFSSVGCPNRCYFCNVQSKKIECRNPKVVVDEMEYLISLGCGSVHVLDDNFNFFKAHLDGILNEMMKRSITNEWSGRGQVRMDLSLTPKMAETGFKRIHVGIEALSDNILKWFNKRQTVSDIEKFCKSMNDSKIDILGYFISGSPVETEEYKKTFPQRIIDLGIKHPFFNVLFPEPNTQYYYDLLKDGIYTKDHWAEYMQNPVKDFEIPYPYGEKKREEVLYYNKEIINMFKK